MQNIDTNLVERFRQGEKDAFDELYERMCQRIYRFGLRLTGCREDAEDLTVQAFAEAYRSRASFRHQSSIETWMFRIAVHQAHRIWRKRRNHHPLDERMHDPAADITREHIELQQVVEALPFKLRSAFLLVKSEGLTYREAAETLGRPMGSVQSDVHEASKRIRGFLSAEANPLDASENFGYEV